MYRRKFIASLALVGALAVSACGGGNWATDYPDTIDPKVSKGWRVVSVDVRVPETLTVSEANTYAPNADIVWREDPFGQGTRYEQVDKIMTAAVKRGAKVLHGRKPVKLVIIMQQFHALTERTRATLQNAGVHDIKFTAQVFDARTGKPLTSADFIRADLIAYVGDQAIAAERQGLTQKVRITNHVAKVISGWLSHKVDVRGSFTRNGR
ncbi:MAG TPA: hypothetical protein ENJ91_09185 [Rhodobacteraceae bacterium]|nr:hypothetical protein [Paracoccaceae bacterium]